MCLDVICSVKVSWDRKTSCREFSCDDNVISEALASFPSEPGRSHYFASCLVPEVSEQGMRNWGSGKAGGIGSGFTNSGSYQLF